MSEANFDSLRIYATKLGLDRIILGMNYPLYTADEYFSILKNKLKLTEDQIQQMTQ